MKLFYVLFMSLVLVNCGPEADSPEAPFGEKAKKYHDEKVSANLSIIDVEEEISLSDTEITKVVYSEFKDELSSKIYAGVMCEPVAPESDAEGYEWIVKSRSELEADNNELLEVKCNKEDLLGNCKKRVYVYKTTCEFKLVEKRKRN